MKKLLLISTLVLFQHIGLEGDSVKAGDIIGYSGLTGNANQNNKPHLHLGIKNSQGRWVDPAPYLNATFQLTSMEMTTPCD